MSLARAAHSANWQGRVHLGFLADFGGVSNYKPELNVVFTNVLGGDRRLTLEPRAGLMCSDAVPKPHGGERCENDDNAVMHCGGLRVDRGRNNNR